VDGKNPTIHEEKFSFIHEGITCRIFSEGESKLKTEKKFEKIQVLENCQFLDNLIEAEKPAVLKGLVECPICGEREKPVFFVNEADLDLHVARVHSETIGDGISDRA